MRISEEQLENRIKQLTALFPSISDGEIILAGAYGGWRVEFAGRDLLDTGYVSKIALYTALNAYYNGVRDAYKAIPKSSIDIVVESAELFADTAEDSEERFEAIEAVRQFGERAI